MFEPTRNLRINALWALLFVIGCAALPTDFERSESHALQDTQNTTVGRAMENDKISYPGLSGFHLLGNGLDAFTARAVLAHLAERSLDVQYYLYRNRSGAQSA